MLCIYPTQIHGFENTGFEEYEQSWQKNNNAIELNFSSEFVKEGTQSAQIANNSTTSYGIEQVIYNILPEQYYKISAYINIQNPPPSKSFIRIAWYESTDGTGSQITTTDSEIVSTETDWKQLIVNTAAPTNAHSAKIRLLVSSGIAYFDEIMFKELDVTPTPIYTPTSVPTPTYVQTIQNLSITEAMVYPNSTSNEWVEIYNNNNFEVTLLDWFIDDTVDSGASPKKFSITILPYNYASVDINSSLFNNAGDDIRLLSPNGEVVDSVSYEDSEKDISIGKNSTNIFCHQKPSKNKSNYSCIESNITPTTVKTVSPTAATTAILGISTKPTISLKPSPIITSKKYTTFITSKPKKLSTNKEEPVEIITTSKANESPGKKPWLIISGSYSLLAGISLVSKMIFFRYT